MSIELVENHIRAFLKSSEPSVLCIRGKWGTGKTYTWNKVFSELRSEKNIGLNEYSYISLFGLNSLEQLKGAVFENGVRIDDSATTPSVGSLTKKAQKISHLAGRRALGIAKNMPSVEGYASGLVNLFFLSVSEQIVCIDDIERRGEDLRIKDVLGLVSYLKEFKGCKVCLILNDEALVDSGQKDFETYFEKSIDQFLRFAPSAEHCALVALSSYQDLAPLVRPSCLKLDITNIRIVAQIGRLGRLLAPILSSHHPKVLEEGIRTLVLLVWSKFSPDAPPIEFVRRRTRSSHLFDSRATETSETDKAWNDLLDDFGFGNLDEVDLLIASGVEDGYFDDQKIHEMATISDKQFESQAALESQQIAWQTYHDSFRDNEAEVINAVYRAFEDNIQHISISNVHGTVSLLKDLGRNDLAQEVIRRFVAERQEDARFFDLSKYPFADDIRDEDLVRALNERSRSYPEMKDPKEILLRIEKTRGWSSGDATVLARLSVDDFYKLFVSAKGGELDDLVRCSLRFGKSGNASDVDRHISETAITALKRIGKTSRLNARRVRKFGIEVTK